MPFIIYLAGKLDEDCQGTNAFCSALPGHLGHFVGVPWHPLDTWDNLMAFQGTSKEAFRWCFEALSRTTQRVYANARKLITATNTISNTCALSRTVRTTVRLIDNRREVGFCGELLIWHFEAVWNDSNVNKTLHSNSIMCSYRTRSRINHTRNLQPHETDKRCARRLASAECCPVVLFGQGHMECDDTTGCRNPCGACIWAFYHS